MFNRYSLCLFSVAASLALGGVSAYSQDGAKPAEKPAADLSLDSLMVEPPKAPEKLKIDPKITEIPEKASVDELFEFVESLQDRLPQPKSQADLAQIVDVYSQTCLKVANKILENKDLTAEQRDRGVQLKVVALTTRAHEDPDAAAELDKFVDANLKAAKTEDELIKAYQLKLQVVASKDEPLDQIKALADEMYAREQEELQVFAIEVKAQAFITQFQRDGSFDDELVAFVDKTIADKARAAKVREKAYEMKLVSAIIASEIEREKAEAEQDPKKFENVENLFELLTSAQFSLDLKKMVYQLRVQMLLDPNSTDKDAKEKIAATIEKLLNEEDAELYALGVAVKGQTLLDAAKDDPEAVKNLRKYADEIVALSKERKELRTQAAGLQIQTFRLEKNPEGLLDFVNAQLADEPGDLEEKLLQIKVSVAAELVEKDPANFAKFEEFLNKSLDNEALADGVSQVYLARFVGSVEAIAQNKGDKKAFDAALDQFKKDLEKTPKALIALIMPQTREAIDAIGANNKIDDLFGDVFTQILDFCKVSSSDALNQLAQQLEAMQAQILKAPTAEEADEPKADDEKKADAEK